MEADAMDAVQAQITAWRQQLTGLSLRWRDTDKVEALGTLAAECKLLLSTINAVLEPSQLLKLPEELLKRILSHCDATALGSLESVSHLFRNGLVDQAVDHAAVVQHGEKLAALRPQRLSWSRQSRAAGAS